MRLNSARHAASTLGSAIYCSYVRASCHLTVRRVERTPSGGGEPGPGFLSCAHVGQTHQRRVSADVGPIAQHGINNLVGGWGCRGLPNNDRLKRSAVTLHCLELRLVDTLV